MAEAVTGPTPGMVRSSMTWGSLRPSSRMRLSYQRRRRCRAAIWLHRFVRTSMAASGILGRSPPRTAFANFTALPTPWAIKMPNSPNRPRNMLLSWVRCRTTRSRAPERCSWPDLGQLFYLHWVAHFLAIDNNRTKAPCDAGEAGAIHPIWYDWPHRSISNVSRRSAIGRSPKLDNESFSQVTKWAVG